jgi:homoserine kinase
MPAVTVRVPATSANLGPGYDSFGLALGMFNQFSAEPADEWAVEVVGEGKDVLGTGPTNKVAVAMRAAFAESGEPDRTARVFCVNKIPLGHGLGSSAAAIVGGLLLADAMAEVPLGRNRVFEMAAEMEGHPDNAAAALFGGLAISWRDESGDPRCATIDPACGLAAVIVMATEPLSTSEARMLLPAEIPHADAAFSASRAGLLAAGMTLGRSDLVAAGLHDRIHEPYREHAVPDLESVRDALLDAGALGATLSGAGPTVIGLVDAESDDEAFAVARAVAERAGRTLRDSDARLEPRVVPIERSGVRFS